MYQVLRFGALGVLCAGAALVALLAGPGTSAQAAEFSNYRALYALELSGLPGARVDGSGETELRYVCRGWRYHSIIDMAVDAKLNGQPISLDVRQDTLVEELEDHSAAAYRDIKTINGQQTQERGTLVRREDGSLQLTVARGGQETSQTLEGDVLLPLEQFLAGLRRAEAGTQSFRMQVFSTASHRAEQQEVLRVREVAANASASDPEGLLDARTWEFVVVTTFADRGPIEGAFALTENGIFTDMSFVLMPGVTVSARLVDVQPLAPRECS
jgi:hypothetical protein